MPINLRLTQRLSSPAVCSLWRPVILLPQILVDRFSEDQLRTVLLHELCHIKRADPWINAAQTLIQVFYFYNPLVWLANTCIRRVREQAVDEGVLVCLQGRRHCYSHTLIDIAEVVALRPKLGMGLIGVAESKTQLNERINLMLHKPIPKTASLGLLGLALILLLGIIVLPMAAAQSGVANNPWFEPVDVETRTDLLNEIQTMVDNTLRAFNAGDVPGVMSIFTTDAVALPLEHEALVGKGALHKQHVEEIDKGAKIQGIKEGNQRIWMCGDFIYAVGPYAVAVTVPEIPGMVTDFRTGLTILQRQANGSLKIRVDAYNRDPVPDDPLNFGSDTQHAGTVVQRCTTVSPDTGSQEALHQEIRKLEKIFHDLFVVRDAKKAIGYYAEDAELVIMGYPVIRGKDSIAKVIIKGMQENPPLTALQQDIIQIDGNANMIYVVNLFKWTMKDRASGNEFSLSGKGVHVWQRQGDETWKILIDINNLDRPI